MHLNSKCFFCCTPCFGAEQRSCQIVLFGQRKACCFIFCHIRAITWSPVCFIVAVLISDLVSVCCSLFINFFPALSYSFLSIYFPVIFFSLNTFCQAPKETYLFTANKGQWISGASLQIYSVSTKEKPLPWISSLILHTHNGSL